MIAFIGASKSTVPFIEAAKRMGYPTIAFDQDINALGLDVARFYDVISTHDTQSIIRSLQNDDIEGCVTYSSDPMALKTYATVCDKFNLPGPSRKTMHLTLDRIALKERLIELDIPTPAYKTIGTWQEMDAFLKQYGKAILKPSAGGTGNASVRFVEHEDSHRCLWLDDALQDSKTAIIEEYVDGAEYSIDGFVENGIPYFLNVAEKFVVFYQRMTKQHAKLLGFENCDYSPEVTGAIRLTTTLLMKLGINNTFFSVDIKGGKVLDVGLLLDCKIDRLLFHTGFDIYEAYVKLATGQRVFWPLDKMPEFKPGYKLHFNYPAGTGELSDITGISIWDNEGGKIADES